MRLSVKASDPGFCEKIYELQVKVFCDGEEIPKVITADDRQGYVLAYAVDKDGQFIVERDESGFPEIKTIEYFGQVEIRL